MKLRTFSLIALTCGVLLLAVGITSPMIVLHSTATGGNFGIIGGSDAPTYQFILWNVLNGWPLCAALFGASFVITALFCLIFSKAVHTHCALNTSAVSVGLSVVGAMGLVCAFIGFTIAIFNEVSRYPIEYPVSICLGLTCLMVFFLLIALYFYFRLKRWSWIGFVVDVLTSILYLPPCLVTCYLLSNLIR